MLRSPMSIFRFPEQHLQKWRSLVTTPAEQIVSEIQGIDKIYSFSQPDGAMIVAIFKVGVSRNDAVVRIYNKLYSNKDWMPQGVGVGEPIIKPKGIEDVPIVNITLSDQSGHYDPATAHSGRAWVGNGTQAH